MPNYDNTNKGTLFKNDLKQSYKHPDFTGTINIDGKEKRIAGWNRESKNGDKTFISLAISEIPKDTTQKSAAWQSARDKFGKQEPLDTEEPVALGDIPF